MTQSSQIPDLKQHAAHRNAWRGLGSAKSNDACLNSLVSWRFPDLCRRTGTRSYRTAAILAARSCGCSACQRRADFSFSRFRSYGPLSILH